MNEEKICCPKFDPSSWDNKEFNWDNKRFIKDKKYGKNYVVLVGQID